MKERALFLYAHGYPDEQGLSTADRRAFACLRALACLAEVDLLCLIPCRAAGYPAPAGLGPLCRSITAIPAPPTRLAGVWRAAAAALTSNPIGVALKRSPEARRRLRDMIARNAYALVYAYSPLSLACCLSDLGQRNGPPLLVEVVEVLYAALRSYTAEPARAIGLGMAIQARQWPLMRKFERTVYARADRVICLSREEAELVQALGADIQTTVLPLAVDCSVFRPAGDADGGKEPCMLFTGNFLHPPNVLAAVELCGKILPAVRTRFPAARMLFVGKGAATALGPLAGESVELHDSVPDLLPFYHRAAVVAGPVRTGCGVRGKFLEALAAGCPVVTTPLGASGIEVDRSDGLIAEESAEGMAAAIADLLSDPAARAGLSRRCASAVRVRHSHEEHQRLMTALLAPFLYGKGRDGPASAVPAGTAGVL